MNGNIIQDSLQVIYQTVLFRIDYTATKEYLIAESKYEVTFDIDRIFLINGLQIDAEEIDITDLAYTIGKDDFFTFLIEQIYENYEN